MTSLSYYFMMRVCVIDIIKVGVCSGWCVCVCVVCSSHKSPENKDNLEFFAVVVGWLGPPAKYN